MPTYGLSVTSNSIPTDVWNSASDAERTTIYTGFKENVERTVLNSTFGSGNWQINNSAILTRTGNDNRTNLELQAEVFSQVSIPPEQLPPALSPIDAPSNVTAGPVGQPITPSPQAVGFDNDPFEAERQAAEQRLANQEPVLTADDVGPLDPGVGAQLEFEQQQTRALSSATATEQQPVDTDNDPAVRALDEQSRTEAEQRVNEIYSPVNEAALQANLENLRQQPNRQIITTQSLQGDWRVRLSLAPGANYLYNDPEILSGGNNSILLPLVATNGVIFPYTPEISSAYRADYDTYNLVHSNYRGYFYKSSYVDAVNINAVFTAQDTNEADYLLAVIHFFKSATKMFYGKDSQAGAPPPLVFLNGLGAFQYNNHPCLISQFNYTLPSDVDYIRAGSSRFSGQNQLVQRPRQSVASNPISGAVNRLRNAFGFVPQGGQAPRPSPRSQSSANTTYVPTKITIQLSLLPVQTRRQVSQSLNVKDYASGTLLRKGYW